MSALTPAERAFAVEAGTVIALLRPAAYSVAIVGRLAMAECDLEGLPHRIGVAVADAARRTQALRLVDASWEVAA